MPHGLATHKRAQVSGGASHPPMYVQRAAPMWESVLRNVVSPSESLSFNCNSQAPFSRVEGVFPERKHLRFTIW